MHATMVRSRKRWQMEASGVMMTQKKLSFDELKAWKERAFNEGDLLLAAYYQNEILIRQLETVTWAIREKTIQGIIK